MLQLERTGVVRARRSGEARARPLPRAGLAVAAGHSTRRLRTRRRSERPAVRPAPSARTGQLASAAALHRFSFSFRFIGQQQFQFQFLLLVRLLQRRHWAQLCIQWC